MLRRRRGFGAATSPVARFEGAWISASSGGRAEVPMATGLGGSRWSHSPSLLYAETAGICVDGEVLHAVAAAVNAGQPC